MREEAVVEFKRRFNMLVENATPNTIKYGTTGSRLRFHMALNILGTAPTDLNQDKDWIWVDDKYFSPILTEDEYFSEDYDSFLDELFQNLLYKVNSRKTN